MVQTRTIGDLVSGEIERTLEISNQVLTDNSADNNVIKYSVFQTNQSQSRKSGQMLERASKSSVPESFSCLIM